MVWKLQRCRLDLLPLFVSLVCRHQPTVMCSFHCHILLILSWKCCWSLSDCLIDTIDPMLRSLVGTISIKALESSGRGWVIKSGGLTVAICMRQYCFNGTADLRLLWELRAWMRTGEQMHRDLGTESLSFLTSAVDWLLFSDRKPFICLAYVDRQKKLLHTELSSSHFVNAFLLNSFMLMLSVQ